jgi:hypothetical protein
MNGCNGFMPVSIGRSSKGSRPSRKLKRWRHKNMELLENNSGIDGKLLGHVGSLATEVFGEPWAALHNFSIWHSDPDGSYGGRWKNDATGYSYGE